MSFIFGVPRGPLYLHLFHGREPGATPPDGEWGFDGPVLLVYGFHVTYNATYRVALDEEGNDEWVELSFVDDCLYYDGKCYGDWSISAHPIFPVGFGLFAPISTMDETLMTPTPPAPAPLDYQEQARKLVFEWYGVRVDDEEFMTPKQWAEWYGRKYDLQRFDPHA